VGKGSLRALPPFVQLLKLCSTARIGSLGTTQLVEYITSSLNEIIR